METLDYLKLANQADLKGEPFVINMMTNFTDGILQQMLKGVLVEEGVSAEIEGVPYGQYHLHLKDRKSLLYARRADMTFVLFDTNFHRRSALMDDPAHMQEVLEDIVQYCRDSAAPVIVSTFLIPYRGAYGNLFHESPEYRRVEEANNYLKQQAGEVANLSVWDINALIHHLGEAHVRDLRGLYAFDIPFTNDFFLAVAREWASWVRAKLGRTKKCLVLDLDNTLWGGIVGEVGPEGIALGPDHPGLAFQNFQHAIRELYERGVILAINSKNNPEDVAEVFEKNPHMILGEKHFAASRINWNDKASNIAEIAEELNIGLDSMVFLDDDAVNRGLVRSMHPNVLVPDFPTEPEDYVAHLFSLDAFNQFSLTEEDKEKGRMYAEERGRKVVRASTQSLEEYIATLGIVITVKKNDINSIQRLAQLTQKTNQFNLTTKRYGEKEIEQMMKDGALIFSAEVSDRFGDYGNTILCIVKQDSIHEAELDTFLMSCRVMGRGVEYAFLQHVAEVLRDRGVERMWATFVPTAKNKPAADFLPSAGFAERERIGDTLIYEAELFRLILQLGEKCSGIAVTTSEHE